MMVDDVISLAIKLEEDGYEFYSKVSQNFQQERLKESFDFLAKQELKHAEVFRKMKNSDDKDLSNTWDENEAYISTFVSSSVFPDVRELLKNIENLKVIDLLKFAIDVEKNTLIVYYELLEKIKDKKALKEIINEEKKHLEMLTKISAGL
ncbi:MAG: hypothetical protein PWQ48_1525 [Thermotogaceae bacterium]|jgi:rubrerythrin|nr:hypothetical protein [Thermotogaceae bacterium]